MFLYVEIKKYANFSTPSWQNFSCLKIIQQRCQAFLLHFHDDEILPKEKFKRTSKNKWNSLKKIHLRSAGIKLLFITSHSNLINEQSVPVSMNERLLWE